MHDRVLYNDTQTITDINRDYTPALVTLAGFIFTQIHKCFLEILNTKIKLSCVSFAPHSRIFLVVGSLISTARTTVRN